MENTSRVARDWSVMAGEEVTVEYIKGAYYGFCSELGSLRILRKYMHFEGVGTSTRGTVSKMRQGYSPTTKTHYICLETSTETL